MLREYTMTSGRLQYQPVTLARLDQFHSLVQDDHVRRYLMDGELFPLAWSEQRVRDSIGLFERRGVGVWLAYERTTGELAGFCGFLEMPSLHPEPQLVYALRERFTGIGYATEMAVASISEARRHPGFSTIVAGVDEVNVASVRVLEKLGFRRAATSPRNFGNTLVLLLDETPAGLTVTRLAGSR
jgi:RimJ/RimL family protein N-acetyltransferase